MDLPTTKAVITEHDASEGFEASKHGCSCRSCAVAQVYHRMFPGCDVWVYNDAIDVDVFSNIPLPPTTAAFIHEFNLAMDKNSKKTVMALVGREIEIPVPPGYQLPRQESTDANPTT